MTQEDNDKSQNDELIKTIEDLQKQNKALKESAKKDKLNMLRKQILAFKKDDPEALQAIENEDFLSKRLEMRENEAAESEKKKDETPKKDIVNNSVGAKLPNANIKNNADPKREVDSDFFNGGIIPKYGQIFQNDLMNKLNADPKWKNSARFCRLNGKELTG